MNDYFQSIINLNLNFLAIAIVVNLVFVILLKYDI